MGLFDKILGREKGNQAQKTNLANTNPNNTLSDQTSIDWRLLSAVIPSGWSSV